MNLGLLNLQQRIIGGAAAVVLVSVFLPWATVSLFGYSDSILGIEADGKITLVLSAAGLALIAMAAGAFSVPQLEGKVSDIIQIVLGALVALIGIVDMNSFASIGLYLTLLGGLAWTAVAVWHFLLAHTTVLSGQKSPEGPA